MGKKKDVPEEENKEPDFVCGGKETTYKRLKKRVKELEESRDDSI